MMHARAAGRTGRLRVTVTDGRGRSLSLARPLERWVEQHAPAGARGTMAIALVTDARMRALNRTFRRVDTPTDVLSFATAEVASPPARPPESRQVHSTAASSKGPKPRSVSPGPPPHIGDLAIALGVAGRQARNEGHDLATELRILALHGLLHLLGYDHERDQGTMRRLEERLRRRAGLPAGLIARTPPAVRRPLHR